MRDLVLWICTLAVYSPEEGLLSVGVFSFSFGLDFFTLGDSPDGDL